MRSAGDLPIQYDRLARTHRCKYKIASFVSSAKRFREVRRSTELVAPQGFEPRLIGSEPTVLPLNERAIQIEYGSCRLGREPQSAASLSVRARLEWVNSVSLLFAQNLKRLLSQHAMTRQPARSHRESGGHKERDQVPGDIQVIVEVKHAF